jgi:glycosyltransferase involved in cell wall biosynthesis
VLGQTRLPDEIVVVDDGSTDDTLEVIASYLSRGVRYVRQPNGGAGAARNRGICETTGEWIAFLDGDDCWLPDKLALQTAHVAQNPGVGLVTGSEWQIYESGEQPYLLQREPVDCAFGYPRILVENTLGNPSLALVRRECFRTVGMFDEDMPLGQDWEMWIRIAKRYPVGVVDAPLILFNRHASSLTASKVTERHRSNQRIHERHIGKVRNPIVRLLLRLSAQSMDLYYTAAFLADATSGKQRTRAFGMALAAALMDPTYATRNKVGLLLRLALGKRVISQLPHRRRSLPEGKSTP